jgi:hypothetical protein
MEYLDILNIVVEAHLYAVKQVRFEMKKHRRRIELSDDRMAEIKSIIKSLNYENTIAGHAYINSDYDAGSTYVDVSENLTNYYLNSHVVKCLKDPLEGIKSDAAKFYTLFLQEVELWQMLHSQPIEKNAQVNENIEYSDELLCLFKNNKTLISELVGKSDDEIASLLKQWAKQKDTNGKTLIENPENNLRSSFATELKNAGIIKMSIDRFRRLL